MAEFDTIIKDGMIVDGTRVPRYKADVGIKNGKIGKIGSIVATGPKSSTLRGRLSPQAISTCTHITMPRFTGILIVRSRVGMA